MRRNKVQQVMANLSITKHPMRPTRILQVANLSVNGGTKLLAELEKLGLIKKVFQVSGAKIKRRSFVTITEKGLEALKLLNQLKELLGSLVWK